MSNPDIGGNPSASAWLISEVVDLLSPIGWTVAIVTLGIGSYWLAGKAIDRGAEFYKTLREMAAR